MISSAFFKKSLFFSLIGHITVLGLFNFSFGYKIPALGFAQVHSWGGVLDKHDLLPFFSPAMVNFRRNLRSGFQATLLPGFSSKDYALAGGFYLKPQVCLLANEEKLTFAEKLPPAAFIKKREKQIIMFHPHLPVHFSLFFKDRQTVHIELMFNMINSGRTNSITVKRKISSGNLEADLLSMRYIGHYLFLQQAGFTENNWQTVKIDLSTKDD